jgi:hypothetical protein
MTKIGEKREKYDMLNRGGFGYNGNDETGTAMKKA